MGGVPGSSKPPAVNRFMSCCRACASSTSRLVSGSIIAISAWMRRCCASSASYWRARFSVLILSVICSCTGSFHMDPAILSTSLHYTIPSYQHQRESNTGSCLTIISIICADEGHDTIASAKAGVAFGGFLGKEWTTHHAHSVAVIGLLHVSANLTPSTSIIKARSLTWASINSFSLYQPVRTQHMHLSPDSRDGNHSSVRIHS